MSKRDLFKDKLAHSMDLNAAGKFSEASLILEEYIKEEPKDYVALVNLASNYRWLGKTDKALNLLKESILVNPKGAAAYNNIGNILNQLGKLEESEEEYKKALELDPNIDHIHENLGGVLYKLGKFSESISIYRLSKRNNEAEILQCLLALDRIDEFWREIEQLSTNKPQIKVAAISSYVSEKLSIEDIYPFCRNPLDKILVSKFNFFDQELLETLKRVKIASENSNLDDTYQSLLKNGKQTSGNFFQTLDKNLGSAFYQYVSEIAHSYKETFKNSNDALINDWPKNHYLYGWFIKMKKQGYLDYHNHDNAWVSGSVYFQIPEDVSEDQAAIKFTCDYKNYPKINDKNLTEELLK